MDISGKINNYASYLCALQLTGDIGIHIRHACRTGYNALEALEMNVGLNYNRDIALTLTSSTVSNVVYDYSLQNRYGPPAERFSQCVIM